LVEGRCLARAVGLTLDLARRRALRSRKCCVAFCS
jgi:hypothetical protein